MDNPLPTDNSWPTQAADPSMFIFQLPLAVAVFVVPPTVMDIVPVLESDKFVNKLFFTESVMLPAVIEL